MPELQSPQPNPLPPNEWKFAAVVALVFLAISTLNVAAHVPWRDELRWWQIALASPTFAEMRLNMQFEGAPWLWYGLVWLLARLTTNFFALQFVHVCFAAATVFLFAWRAPFSRFARLLFPFGYFTFFEYAVISRNYAISVCLVFAATALISASRHRPFLLAVVLGLLTQTSIWGAGLALVLASTAGLEWFCLSSPTTRWSWRDVALLSSVVSIGFILCYLDCLPGPGESFIARWPAAMDFGTKWTASVGTVWNGWLPLPRATRSFWNTNLLDDQLNARCLASCLLLFFVSASLLRRPAALWIFLGGTAGLLSFTFFHFVGSARHQGLLFVVLVVACWLGATSTRIEFPWPRATRIVDALDLRRSSWLIMLLGIQAVSGITVSIADRFFPFSASAEVADYLHREFPDDVLLVGYDDYCVAPVGIYLNRPVYSPQMGAMHDFYFSQNDEVRREVTKDSLLAQVEALQLRHPRDVVVILSPRRHKEFLQWQADDPEMPQWEHLKTFADSTVADEGASLYLARSKTTHRPIRRGDIRSRE